MGRLTKFSANLGLLWKELALPDAIRAAKRAGFDAVEFQFPYEVPVGEIKQALSETGLPLISLNTIRGNIAAGEFGMSALRGREVDAQAAIDLALSYATQTNASFVHVMAGIADGPPAHRAFVKNLNYACQKASELGIGILIEPLNHFDIPGYFLSNSVHAQSLIEEIGAPNLKLMFDCYHIQRMEGDLHNRLKELMPIIGHIQFASVPDRGPPDHGDLDYEHVFSVIKDLGFKRPLGAEYNPVDDTEASLGWMKHFL